MKFVVELNPAMHIEYVTVEAESEKEAIEIAKKEADDTRGLIDLTQSHWEVINVYPHSGEEKFLV